MTYDQWKLSSPEDEWTPPSNDEGVPDDDQLLDQAVAAARTTPDEQFDALLGMIGLVQLICAREDCPPDIKSAMLSNHRYVDARAVAKAYL